MLIDTHTHINSEYYNDIDNVVINAKNNGVGILIVSCCDKNSIIEGLELQKKYENIFFTIGFHPDQANVVNDSDILWLKELASKNKKIVGIGEIGLDYHYINENSALQKKLLEKQLSLANELKLPVVIHNRDATADVLNILKKFKLKGIIHCFSGSYETAIEYIKLGYYIGIGGVVTFKNSKLFEVIERLSINDIVLETDSPYLSPEPHRGELNESKNLIYICKKVSEIKKLDFSKVETITTNNAFALFDIKI